MEEVTVKAVNDATITQGRILEIQAPNSFLAEKFQPANQGELDAARREIREKSRPQIEPAPTNHRDLRDEIRVETINQEERNRIAAQNASRPERNEHGVGRVTLPSEKHDSLLAVVQGGLAANASQEAA